jgi:hypothetical protein
MRTKTAYRNKPENIPAEIPEIPNIPQVKIDGQRVEPDVTATAEVPRSAVEVDEAFKRQAESSDPSLALARQIEELRKSEALQRQAAMMPQRPLSPEEKLAAWRSQGMSEADERFLVEHPLMVEHSALTAQAAAVAAQQYQRGTDDHRRATKQLFDQHLAHLAQAAANPVPTAQPIPEYFRPPEPKPESTPSPASYTSAPVSRSGGGFQSSRVTLTREDKEYARIAGISDVEYAKQKQRLAEMKASGEYSERR